MKELLKEYGIADTRLLDATKSIENISDDTLREFCGRFGLTPASADVPQTARLVADALLKGADSVDKVVGYVRKRMMGHVEKPVVLNAPVRIVGVPVVDNAEVIIAPVVPLAAVATIRPGRGRRKNGRSDMCKAVALIEAAGEAADRDTILASLVAGGLNKSSAAVYLWRYNKGERD